MPRARATEPGREPYQHRGARAAPLRAPHFFFYVRKGPQPEGQSWPMQVIVQKKSGDEKYAPGGSFMSDAPGGTFCCCAPETGGTIG